MGSSCPLMLSICSAYSVPLLSERENPLTWEEYTFPKPLPIQPVILVLYGAYVVVWFTFVTLYELHLRRVTTPFTTTGSKVSGPGGGGGGGLFCKFINWVIRIVSAKRNLTPRRIGPSLSSCIHKHIESREGGRSSQEGSSILPHQNRAEAVHDGFRGGSRNLGRGGHRKGVGAGGGCAPSRAKRGSFEQYNNTDTHS